MKIYGILIAASFAAAFVSGAAGFGGTLLLLGAALILLVLAKALNKLELKNTKRTMLIGGAVTGLVSGLAGSGGPIGAAAFLTLKLPP